MSLKVLADAYAEDKRFLAGPETELHAVADARVNDVAVAVRYAFAGARPAFSGDETQEEVEAIMERSADKLETLLAKILPSALSRVMLAGGETGMKMLADQLRTLGGPGSGNFGHAGRPGKVGGSGDGHAELDKLQIEHGDIIPHNALFSKYDMDHEAVAVFDAIDTSQPGVPETLNLDDLTVVQDEVGAEGLRHYLYGTGRSKGNPIVLRLSGKNYLMDGHHRVGAMLLEGKKAAKFEVYDANTLLGLEESGASDYFSPRAYESEVELKGESQLGAYNFENKSLGGPGSGNFGHAGRPGHVGGSAADDAYVDDKGSSWSAMNNGTLSEMLDHHTDLRSPAAKTLIKELERREKKGDARAAEVLAGVGTRKNGNGTITSKDGKKYNVKFDAERRTYTIQEPDAPRGVNVGAATMTRKEGSTGGRAVMSIHVYPEFQRKGIATALYKHIEQHLGTTLQANWAQTPDGEAFWKSRSMEDFRFAKRITVKAPVMDISFDGTSEGASQWAKKYAGKLAKKLTKTSRAEIKAAIASVFEGGSFKTARNKIADAIGDDARADLIARQEVMVAVHEGQRLAWQQALREGFLTKTMRRTWIITPGACPRCQKLDGKTARLNGTYRGGIAGPPLHVRCRCTEGLQ